MSLGCKNTTGLPWAPILGSADSSRAWLDTAFMLDCTGESRNLVNIFETILNDPVGPIPAWAVEPALRSISKVNAHAFSGHQLPRLPLSNPHAPARTQQSTSFPTQPPSLAP